MTVQLGFAVGSGEPIEVPLRNTVVCGQTQESGKTTTLEAMVSRSGVRALAFVTKRGESAFASATRIPPYFRERTDWEFVASILEAERREKLKFERAWIMRACKGARTLADVQGNVKKGMNESKRGMDRDVYLTLDAYLENVVPVLRHVKFAPSIELAEGLNVMDLSSLKSEVQQLVIAASLQWVYRHERGVVTVLPEAWEFVPQGRRSPVKLAAIELVRKGSALKNFVWLDSQDIGGVEKELLRSCPVWLLGVQREANEVKRTLANIPMSVGKPKPADVATLGRGEFLACFGHHVIRTYVWPAWMSEDEACAVARGESPLPPPAVEDVGNSKFRIQNSELEIEETDMSQQDVNEIKSSIAELARSVSALAERQADPNPEPRTLPSPNPHGSANGSIDEESLFARFKARLMKEAPALVRVLSHRPELRVEEERRVIELDASTAKGAFGKLVAQGFFDETNSGQAAYDELRRRGVRVAKPSVYDWGKEFAGLGILTIEKAGNWKTVEGMKKSVVQK